MPTGETQSRSPHRTEDRKDKAEMTMIPRFSPQDDDQPERQNECTCYTDCRSDSYSGRLHQHEDEPCPIHDESVSPMVG